MKFVLLIASVLVAVTAFPYGLVENEEGQQFYMVPLGRSKRQTTTWKVESPGIGTITHSGTILNNDKHKLDGTGYLTKDFRTHGLTPDAYGGHLDYNHKPSGLGVGLGADHMRGFGTDAKATASWNFINEKNAQVGISGQYGRHFGGPGGTGRPDYGVFLGGRINF